MKKAIQIFLYSAMLALGIGIGIWLTPSGLTGTNTVSQIIQLLRGNYVDTVNVDQLEHDAVNHMLHTLDPHSNYFSETEAKRVNEPLEGSFEGIGIEFFVLKDSIYVAQVIDDGPAQKAGLRAGDHIIGVDGKSLGDKKLDQEEVYKLLKGVEGSKVNLRIFRPTENQTQEYTVIRASIAIPSVDAGFMVNDHTGYIKISRFASNTMDAFSKISQELKALGMTKLILDLRDNGGGYLNTAQKLADEFLEDHCKILTTKGLHTGEESYNATSSGGLEKGELVVLVNENSASASEILSGALQDNDRAVIAGRRTFGKGLVQNSFTLKNGSVVRITISRYYTPSGRSIQKPYDKGYDAYSDEYTERREHGELFVQDSVKLNAKSPFHTLHGRLVYGGGGIMPDVFIPLDTTHDSPFLDALIEKGTLREVSCFYAERFGQELKRYPNMQQFQKSFVVDNTLLQMLKESASRAGIPWNDVEAKRSVSLINRHLRSGIAKQLFKSKGYYYVECLEDTDVLKAISILESSTYKEILGLK